MTGTTKIEYSRILLKRTEESGVEPTINLTGDSSNIDYTWANTDILIGEQFCNTADNRLWIRGDGGIFEVTMTASGSTAGDYLPLSGGTLTGPLTADTLTISNIGTTPSINNLGIDTNGNVVKGNSSIPVQITYAALSALKVANTISGGTLYHITDRDIFITGLDSDKLSINGSRVMLVPLDIAYTPQTIVGFANSILTGIYGQSIAQGSVPASNFTAGGNIYYAIWGGKLWQRDATGVDGGTTVQNTIDGIGWAEVTTLTTLNEYKTFSINYDFDNDYVSMQSGSNGNIITTHITNTYNGCDITDWNNSTIYNNKCSGIYNNYIDSAIKCTITNNTLNGSIENNTNNGIISNNMIVGNGDVSIKNNSNVGDIKYNTNNGFIANNSNNGVIATNNNAGTIFNNSNAGDINNNNNNGDIANKTGAGSVADPVINK